MIKATALKPGSWSTDLSLSALLLILLLLIFVFYPLGEIGITGGALIEVVFSLMLISGVVSVSTSRPVLVVMCAIAVGAMLSGWWGFVYPNTIIFVVKSSLTSLFIGSLAIIVLIEVFRDGEITFHRIQGAIAAYLLIAVLWAMLYRLIDLLTPGAFQHGPGALRDPVSGPLASEYIYFSLGSLTTMGYTGMTAVHPLSQSLVMMEALIGQLFPAILLARLVSMEVESRNVRRVE